MYQYKAKILNIVDGDTFDVDIDLGFHIHIHERVRLLNVDTPEKFGAEKKLGLIMKQYAEDNFLNKNVIIQSEKNDSAADTDRGHGRCHRGCGHCHGLRETHYADAAQYHAGCHLRAAGGRHRPVHRVHSQGHFPV